MNKTNVEVTAVEGNNKIKQFDTLLYRLSVVRYLIRYLCFELSCYCLTQTRNFVQSFYFSQLSRYEPTYSTTLLNSLNCVLLKVSLQKGS